MRKEAWPIIIGNSLGITEKIFDACSVVFRASLNPKADSEPIFSEHISIIEVDLRRTFPGLSFYHEETQLRTQLQDILQRYCALRLDCGYVQGMSYLGGHLLLYMSPFLAFRSLCNLLSGVLLRDFTSLDTVRMGQWISIFEEILKVLLPHLHSGFIDIQIFADTCLTEWFMTLFSKTLALDVVGRVWDGYLVLGEPFLFQISISILKILEPKISHQPLEVAIKALRTLPKVNFPYHLTHISSLAFPYFSPFFQNISSAELFNSIPSWTRVPRKIREQIQRLRRDPSRSGGVDLQKLNALSLQ